VCRTLPWCLGTLLHPRSSPRIDVRYVVQQARQAPDVASLVGDHHLRCRSLSAHSLPLVWLAYSLTELAGKHGIRSLWDLPTRPSLLVRGKTSLKGRPCSGRAETRLPLTLFLPHPPQPPVVSSAVSFIKPPVVSRTGGRTLPPPRPGSTPCFASVLSTPRPRVGRGGGRGQHRPVQGGGAGEAPDLRPWELPTGVVIAASEKHARDQVVRYGALGLQVGCDQEVQGRGASGGNGGWSRVARAWDVHHWRPPAALRGGSHGLIAHSFRRRV
jgi:hypothetical protein